MGTRSWERSSDSTRPNGPARNGVRLLDRHRQRSRRQHRSSDDERAPATAEHAEDRRELQAVSVRESGQRPRELVERSFTWAGTRCSPTVLLHLLTTAATPIRGRVGLRRKRRRRRDPTGCRRVRPHRRDRQAARHRRHDAPGRDQSGAAWATFLRRGPRAGERPRGRCPARLVCHPRRVPRRRRRLPPEHRGFARGHHRSNPAVRPARPHGDGPRASAPPDVAATRARIRDRHDVPAQGSRRGAGLLRRVRHGKVVPRVATCGQGTGGAAIMG